MARVAFAPPRITPSGYAGYTPRLPNLESTLKYAVYLIGLGSGPHRGIRTGVCRHSSRTRSEVPEPNGIDIAGSLPDRSGVAA